jgi:SAM-dependent methyltransferase
MGKVMTVTPVCANTPDDWWNVLRKKWCEVPAGINTRATTSRLLDVADQLLLSFYSQARSEATSGEAFSIRGWYHTLYKDILRGKRVLDVGCGFGIDGITFAEAGAQVTFLDIVESNVLIVDRICKLRGIKNVEFCYLESFASFSHLRDDFDVIWCQGSLINAPFDIIRAETQELLKHLKRNGRWIELAYPKSRWERDGRMPFDKWGDETDGGAPWMEWYDLPKLRAALEPSQFEVVLYFEFHNSDFNWFDLIRTS